jgi:hypothetical protein
MAFKMEGGIEATGIMSGETTLLVDEPVASAVFESVPLPSMVKARACPA